MDLKQFIRNVPNFPKPGIMFRDITPLLAQPRAMREVIRLFAERFESCRPDVIVAAESRGFIFATPLALELNAGFVPVRKPGKLPFKTRRYGYELEYGSDALEMHEDAVAKGSRVLLLDDLLATGGTMEACAKLVQDSGAQVVGAGFLIELTFLPGRAKLGSYDVHSLIQYDDEN